MATLNAIADAIGEQLQTIDGVYVYPRFEGSIQFPCLLVEPPPALAYHETFSATSGAFRNVAMTVIALVGPYSDGLSGYRQRDLNDLADFTGTKSVRAAIEADKTLGSVVADCIVVGFDLLGIEEVGAIGAWGGRFTLKINGA